MIAAQRHRAFVHLLNHHPIRMVRALQGVDFRSGRILDHERVYFAGINRADGFLGFRQACDQILDEILIGELRLGFRGLAQDCRHGLL